MNTFKKLALVSVFAIPTAAFAQINVGDNVGSTEEAVRTALEAQGYQIMEIEMEDGEIEVEAMLDGAEYEFEISAETGIVYEIELDDDSDEDYSSDAYNKG